MMPRIFLLPVLLLFMATAWSQERPIEIEDEQKLNRLYLYAVNTNLQAFDVGITVTGTGFRQRAGKVRMVHVPARSRVQLSSLIIERGKEPKYEYTLEVSSELSPRALKSEFELIKIEPKFPVTIYQSAGCAEQCTALIAALDESPYRYTHTVLADYPKVFEQISGLIVGGAERLEAMETPIVMMAGKMFLTLSTYEEVMAKMEEL
ncbi:MAG: hypothetical protein ABR84_02260 [Cryomorphaceae bacterium BACL21 MAG-121220-bin10]|nr:MAG: hypothetical protein ABR84_02260 [Cryomorphaceae bacterium BACL21 MAG-121220-bin10]